MARKLKRKAWLCFAKRSLIMLAVLFLAVGLISIIGLEAFSATGLLKDAAALLAEAAADAFGEK